MSKRSSREGELLAGKYKLEKRLGAGGMGEVYRAENTLIGRPVAIKLLLEEHAENADVVARFLREARAANIVRHANVVDVLDIGQDEAGAPFIVQELLEGEDLAAHMTRLGGRVPVDAVLDILVPVMDAVGLAHAKGVVHRDLKPENIFLARTPNGVVPKVLDFGIARIATGDEKRMTATGLSMGTPAYMSPEQIRGDRALDARTDVWALGVILFEVISGALPFQAETYTNLFVKIATEAPLTLDGACPGVPRELAAVVAKCLQRAATDRYANATELADALRRIRALGPIAIPTGRSQRPAPPLLDIGHVATQAWDDAPRAAPLATAVPDLDLPAPAPRRAAPALAASNGPALAVSSAPPLAISSAPPIALASSAPTRGQPAATAPFALPQPPMATIAGIDPFDDELQGSSALDVQPYARPPVAAIARAPRAVSRAGLASHARTTSRRAEERATKERLVGLATVGFVALAGAGVMSTFFGSSGGWPTLAWMTHLGHLPFPMVAAAAGAMLVLGLVAIYEGARARPIAWGLLMVGAGLVVTGLGSAGFVVPTLPNLAGPAAVDALMRDAFPWTALLVPLGLGVHVFRRASAAWSDEARARSVVMAVAVAVAMFAAMQVARGAGRGAADPTVSTS